ncbi:MAG TPA: HicB family protein [Alphaproteobacteria bacterium]|nr:HicB family protein [Alphaproteobacteria bacterium]HAJ48164.1 HicB family protein [Alphaproteobacteria bacterium]
MLTYIVMIEPLSAEDGAGYLATVPDLPGCMSDGATPDDALRNVEDAIEVWIDTAREMGRDVPLPTRRAVISA